MERSTGKSNLGTIYKLGEWAKIFRLQKQIDYLHGILLCMAVLGVSKS